MERSALRAAPTAEALFRDGFGDRVLIRNSQGHPIHESLVLSSEISALSAFEFALAQRVAELEAFDHPGFVRVRKIGRLKGAVPRLTVVADRCPGSRLADILVSMGGRVPESIDAPLSIMRQILDAIGALHRHGSGITHGAIGPERILIAAGKVRITDYVMGSAIERLRYSSDRYWKDLRVAVAPVPGAIRFDERVDVAQVGLVALALFSGRVLHDDQDLMTLDESRVATSLPRSIRSWILRMLRADQRHGLFTIPAASSALEEAIIEAQSKTTFSRPPVVTPPQSQFKPSSHSISLPIAPKPSTQTEPRMGTMYRPGSTRDRGVSWTNGATSRFKTALKIGLLGAALAGAFSV